MFKKCKPGCLMLNSGHFATPFSSQRHISFDRFFILKKGRRGVWMETWKFKTRQDGLELRLSEEKEYIFKEWSALYGRVDFKKEGYGSRKVFYFLLLYFVFHETLLRDFSSWKASDCDLRTVISPTCDGGGIVLWVCLCVCVYSMLLYAWVSATASHACHIQNPDLFERCDRLTRKLLFDEYSNYLNSICSNMHNCVNKYAS